MSLFDGIAPKDDDTTLQIAAARVVDRLLQLPTPRSMCELRPDSDDFAWLVAWTNALGSERLRAGLDGHRRNEVVEAPTPLRRVEALGCLLLLVASEAARREAREGSVWPTVQTQFRPTVQRVLFAGGQPTVAFKDALEAAAVSLGLRHVFGVDGTQCYYVTVYLQFGFTRRGMANLPHWLVGALQSEAVQLLVGINLGSASFKRLWQALRDFRRNNLHERQAQAIVEESPWVLPEWTDELLSQARARPELGVGSSDRSSTHPAERLGFLDTPTLGWDLSTPPRFTARLTNLSLFDLSAPRYEVRRGSAVLAALLRQPDDSYIYPEAIELDADHPRVTMTLTDEEGAVIESQDIELWDSGEDVAVYDQNGRPVDGWQQPLDPRRRYVLLTAPDLSIDPPLPAWCFIGHGARRMSHLGSGWSDDLRVLLEGETLWSPWLGAGRPGPLGDQSWTGEISIAAAMEPRIGAPLEARIDQVPDDAEVNYVRLNGEPWEFRRDGNVWILAPFILTADQAVHGNTVQLGLERWGHRARARLTLHASPTFGVVRAASLGWEPLDPDDSLSVDEARQGIFRPFLGRARSEVTAALFEGFTFSRRATDTPRSLGTLGGFGAPLRLYPRPYNADSQLCTLARSVDAPGIVQGVEQVDGATWHLKLGRAVQLSPEYRVIVWPSGRRAGVISFDRIRVVEPGLWELPGLPVPPEAALLAVEFGGARLGAWWPARPAHSWQLPNHEVLSSRQTAASFAGSTYRCSLESIVPSWKGSPTNTQGHA